MEIYPIENELLVKIKEEILEEQPQGLAMECHVKIEAESDFEVGEVKDWCIENRVAPEIEDIKFSNAVSYHQLMRFTKARCRYCGLIFDNCFNLYKHQVKHLTLSVKTLVYQCNDCTSCFLTKYFLVRHINKKHGPMRIKTEISRLVKKVYDENGRIVITKSLHECQICSKILSYKSYMDHVKYVHGDNRYTCTECGNDFKTKRYLVRHSCIHTTKKQRRSHTYHNTDTTCEHCGKKFINSCAYRIHLKTVHCDAEYKCHICLSQFKCENYLRTHVRRVHYDDGRVHKCEECFKTFKSPRCVKIHKKHCRGPKVKSGRKWKRIPRKKCTASIMMELPTALTQR